MYSRFLIFLCLCAACYGGELDALLQPVTKIDAPNSSTATTSEPRVKVAQETIVALATQALKSAFAIEDGELRVDFLKNLPDIHAPSHAWEVDVKDGLPQAPLSKFLVRVKVLCEGKVVANVLTPVTCEWWREVWFARRPMPRGSVVDIRGFFAQSIDVLKQRKAVILSTEDLAQYELAQAIPQGQPVTWTDVAKHPEIKKGDMIDVEASEGALKLSMPGMALQDGRVDDFISVKNVQSKKDLQARVVGPKRVRIQF